MSEFYTLAPDMAIVPMNDGSFLFKSDTLSVKLEGASTRFLVDRVFPLLQEGKDIGTVARHFDTVSEDDLRVNLDKLVDTGVLRKKKTIAQDQGITGYFSNMLTAMGWDVSEAMRKIKDYKVAVIGLEAHGTQLVIALQQTGFMKFRLCDPFPASKDYLAAFPFLDRDAIDRQSIVKDHLQKLHTDIEVQTGPSLLTKESLEHFVSDADLLVVCADKGFSSLFYWANQISIDRKIPALYAQIKGPVAYIGPFVIPGKTSCYMCYKMRHVAAEENFDEAMTYEEYLNGLKRPDFDSRMVMPSSINFVAGALSSEILKYVIPINYLSLSGKVMELDTLSFQSNTHVVLQKPDCPVCQKKKYEKQHPGSAELINGQEASDLGVLFPDLVSNHCGVIRYLDLVPKDITEPERPYVYVADLANHTFLPKDERNKLNCSGKGMTVKQAMISAAGEAVERYSGTIYSASDITYASYEELGTDALDPQRLVLYHPDQYGKIDYAPFHPHTKMSWVKAYSLLEERSIFVPAHAAILNIPVGQEEYISQATSNGLAAGPTLADAVLSAALEIIERDAFMISWHNRLPCRRVDITQHPSKDVRELYRIYERRGVELQLYALPTDAPVAVYMAIGVQRKGSGPSVVVGLGSDFSPASAARRAVMEVGQVRPAFKKRMRTPQAQERLKILVEDPSRVEELEDHDLLYAVPEHLDAFEFLFDQKIENERWANESPLATGDCLRQLLAFLKVAGSDLIYYNLTPSDMQQFGLYTARAILPDFQPIHFGARNIRLGGHRMYQLPLQLGLQKEVKSPEQLKMFPHPLA